MAPDRPVPKSDEEERPRETFARRHFLSMVGMGAITASAVGSGVLFVEYASPNVLYEPALLFDAGAPDEYEPGVDERWKRKQKIWIVQEQGQLYALVSICTHLGCTPNWDPETSTFRCPCHGSVFALSGDVLRGPAPVPLYRAPIQLDEKGNMIIGTGLLGYGRPEQADEEPDRSSPTYVLKVQA